MFRIKCDINYIKIVYRLPSIKKQMIASGVIGNFLENFDIMLCIFLAHFIALTFFPSSSLENGVFNTFVVFLISYLSRPIGSLIIGIYADKMGRKKPLFFSIFITGTCTFIIGILPSYDSIGIIATFLFLIFRIIQNISVGGEYITSLTYLIENAEKKEKCFFGSWVSVGFNLGTLLASLVVFMLIYFVNINIIPLWSWRIIFIVSILGTFIGFWIRSSLPESLEFILEQAKYKTSQKEHILKQTLKMIRAYPARCLAIICIAWLGVGETAALFVYSPIHMITFNHFSQHQTMAMNSLCLFFLIPLIPLFGLLCDQYDKVKSLILSTVTFFILLIPYFYLLSYGNYVQIVLIKLLFCIPSACYYSVAPVLITQSFPVHLRCTSLGIIYQITQSIAAGCTPLVMIYLLNKYPDTYYASASYLFILCTFTLFALAYLSTQKENELKINSLLTFNQ